MNLPHHQPQPYPFPFAIMQAPDAGRSAAIPLHALNVVPARVELAMQFLVLMAQKTAPKAAVTSVGVEWADLPKQTTEEETAMATACNCVAAYIAGRMPPDLWEMQRVEVVRDALTDSRGGTVHDCPTCRRGVGQSMCQMCMGSGGVIVMPAAARNG